MTGDATGDVSTARLTVRAGYMLKHSDPPGTQLWSATHRGRKMHAVGCSVDTGDQRLVHGRRGFRCHRCAEGVEDRIEELLGRLDKRAGGAW